MKRIGDRLGERLRGLGQPWEIVCFVWVPTVVLGFGLWYALRAKNALGDFPIFRAASKAVLHGHSPYVAADPSALANFDKFVYPPAAAFLLSPLAIVPVGLAKILVFALGVATALLALRLLGVRDWRCYGVAAVSAPVMNSLAIGALTSFLLLGAALTWRYRDRPMLAGSVASVTSVVKLFLWPLGLWLLVTRRVRATAAFCVVGVVAVVAGWAAIGFAGFRTYPHLLRVLSHLETGVSYSPVALLQLPSSVAAAVSAVLVITVVLAVALAARGADGDRRSFAVAVIGSLVATPVLWLHYFALLLIPIALYRPRLSGLWFAPLVLWVTPETHSGGSAWRIGLALAILAVVAARSLGGSVRVNAVVGRSRRLGPVAAAGRR